MPDASEFRNVMGNFATGVTVVTFSSSPPHGLTANAIASVSLEPPLVLVSIDHETKSHELLRDGDVEGFCVNVLAADQQHLGEYFADMTDLAESPFETESTRTEGSGAHIFEDGLAYVDCSVYDSLPAGDHTIYVGKAESAGVLDEEGAALTFFRGEWGSIE